MKKFLALAFATLLAGCVSGTADDDVTKVSDINFGSTAAALAKAIPNVGGSETISTTTTFNLHDSIQHLEDVGNTSISISSNTLDANNGTFAFAQEIKITIQLSTPDPAHPETVLIDHKLTSDEQAGTHLSLPFVPNLNPNTLLDYLGAGEVVLTFYFTGGLTNSIPTDYTHTLILHASVEVNKSL